MTYTISKSINDEKEQAIVKKYGSLLNFKNHVYKLIDDLIKQCEEELHEDAIAT